MIKLGERYWTVLWGTVGIWLQWVGKILFQFGICHSSSDLWSSICVYDPLDLISEHGVCSKAARENVLCVVWVLWTIFSHSCGPGKLFVIPVTGRSILEKKTLNFWWRRIYTSRNGCLIKMISPVVFVTPVVLVEVVNVVVDQNWTLNPDKRIGQVRIG